MRAGALDRRLTILRYAKAGTNGFGEAGGTWSPAGTVSASRQDVSDSERMRASGEGATLTTRFVVRSSELTRSLSREDRVRCEGSTFDIVGLKQVGGRRDGIEITAAVRNEPRP